MIEHGLYLVTPDPCPAQERARMVEQALRAGARVIQLRDKSSSDGAFLRQAISLKELCQSFGAIFIVNDRVDAARVSDADGVHLGQGDLPVAAAREILAPTQLVGLSASHLSEVLQAQGLQPDYLGFGSIFATETKQDAEFAGIELLREVRRRVQLPIVAIGGITGENIGEVLQAGADMVAVVRAAFQGPEVGAQVRGLLDCFHSLRATGGGPRFTPGLHQSARPTQRD